MMNLSSSVFQDGGVIPSRFTCDGENISPPLEFQNIPENAQSLVLVMEDPDVPRSIREDGMWNHWLVWNMPADMEGLDENTVPAGVTGLNTSGRFDYAGPCPPDREHRYFFRLYALNTKLDLAEEASKEDLLVAMEGRILETAELMGRYERIGKRELM